MPATTPAFFGPQVIRATFVLAVFGWGVGFYGPPIFLHAVMQRTAWPLELVSTAVTLHFLFGAWVVTRLPAWHRRHGMGPTAVAGSVVTTLGLVGWATAAAPWQLFVAALASGGGWVTLGAVAVNAAIAPWFERTRPRALSLAYNGASVGGVIFAPLWVALMATLGFAMAAWVVGLVMVVVVLRLSRTVWALSPQMLGQHPDGEAPALTVTVTAMPTATATATTAAAAASASASAPGPAPTPANGGAGATPPTDEPGQPLWRNRQFLSLALAMALGLFAQIGLLAHLFGLLVPVMGATAAGWAMGLATGCAIAGRFVAARAMPPGTDRRVVAATAYGVQCLASLLLWWTGGQPLALLLLAVVLFGSGIGNATSLPPLIAQAEFSGDHTARVIALIVALSQGAYAFAPACLGAVLAASQAGGGLGLGQGTGPFFAVVVLAQALAITSLLVGRRRG